MMPTSGNVKMAIEALRSARWRSLLTMLGIIIGVVSVTTIVSLGEGATQGIVGQINQSGEDLITVRPGKIIDREAANLGGLNLLGGVASGSLSDKDFQTLSSVDSIQQVVPMSYVTNVASREDVEYDKGLVIGTSEELPGALKQKIEYGSFFSESDANKNGAVIGKRVAEKLFGQNVPVGRLFTIRDKVFVVRGIFEEFQVSPLAPTANYNTAIFIPYDVGVEIAGESNIYQIMVRPGESTELSQAVDDIESTLAESRDGQQDFSVLTQSERLATANEVLDVMTAFIASIAFVSLLVAGIGILNIMLVSVTERTREIGVRKAVGATNRQILNQFLTEAAILSTLGGALGVMLSVLTNWILRIFTDLTPVLTWPIMVIAVVVAIGVGIIFGTTPAIKAARKHPIESLRYE